jgi:hypothetical protein
MGFWAPGGLFVGILTPGGLFMVLCRIYIDKMPEM